MYIEIKFLHFCCAVLTLLSFSVRSFWKFFSPKQLQRPFIKIIPHVIDTVLFVSGITLVVLIQQYPFVHDWITIKFFAVLCYIVCGALVLKYAKTFLVRIIALIVAWGSFAYVVWLALYHQPNPFA